MFCTGSVLNTYIVLGPVQVTQLLKPVVWYETCEQVSQMVAGLWREALSYQQGQLSERQETGVSTSRPVGRASVRWVY